jgi:hypothetical protein
MNNFIKRLERRIAGNSELQAFYDKLVNNNCYLELENNLETRLLVTALQAEMGGLIGEALVTPNVYPALIMHTTLPSTPLCIISDKRDELLNEILDKDLLQYQNLKNSIIGRSFAIEAFLESGRTFTALYIKNYQDNIMENLSRLQAKYTNLSLKQVDYLPQNLHGSTYVINDTRHEKPKLFLASVITTQCNQALKDSLELTKIFINNCYDTDFKQRISDLNDLLKKHDIDLSELVNLDRSFNFNFHQQQEFSEIHQN